MRTRRNYNLLKDVSRTGAPAGAVVTGTIKSNAGLRIKVLEEQSRGNWGPVHGCFVILDAGENIHTETLTPMVGQVFNAEKILRITRRAHPMCINVVNARVLMLERRVRAQTKAPRVMTR